MVAIFAANDIRKHLLRRTHARSTHTVHTHIQCTHMSVRLMCDQPRESPNHPINMPPTHHTRRRRRRRRCPSPSWAATPSRPCQRHYTAHTRRACVCLPCVCVCVRVGVHLVCSEPYRTHSSPSKRGELPLPLPHALTPEQRQTHTHTWAPTGVSVCAGVKTMYSYFTLHYLPFRQTTTHFREPPPAPPPSTHLVSSSPPCLRSSLLSIVLMPPFPRPRLLRKTFI